MKSLVILITLCASFAYGSDHWDSCSNASGSVKMEYGILYVNGDSVSFDDVKVLKTLKTESEDCVLADSNPPMTVVAFDNTTTVEEVSYKYMAVDHTTLLICERGGSGVPAAATCAE